MYPMKKYTRLLVLGLTLLGPVSAQAKVAAFNLEVSEISDLKVSDEKIECTASGTAMMASIIPAHAEGEALIFYGRPARMNEIIAENCTITITRSRSDNQEIDDYYTAYWNNALKALRSTDKDSLLVISAQKADLSISDQTVKKVVGKGFHAVRKPRTLDR